MTWYVSHTSPQWHFSGIKKAFPLLIQTILGEPGANSERWGIKVEMGGSIFDKEKWKGKVRACSYFPWRCFPSPHYLPLGLSEDGSKHSGLVTNKLKPVIGDSTAWATQVGPLWFALPSNNLFQSTFIYQPQNCANLDLLTVYWGVYLKFIACFIGHQGANCPFSLHSIQLFIEYACKVHHFAIESAPQNSLNAYNAGQRILL